MSFMPILTEDLLPGTQVERTASFDLITEEKRMMVKLHDGS